MIFFGKGPAPKSQTNKQAYFLMTYKTNVALTLSIIP